MRSQTASPIATESARFGLLVLLLPILIGAAESRNASRPTHHAYVFRPETNTWNSQNGHPRRCPLSAAESKELKRGVQVPLAHVYGSCSPLGSANSSWMEALSRMLQQDEARTRARRSALARNGSGIESPESVSLPIRGGRSAEVGLFITTLGFGTPAQNMTVGIDTGSDLTWIQCQPCTECHPQREPIFAPANSSSYGRVRCTSADCRRAALATLNPRHCDPASLGWCLYALGYMDGSLTFGDVAYERLTLGSDSVRGFVFGCGHANTGLRNMAGMLGLGRTEVSLVSQTRSKYKAQFSYCLPNYEAPDAVGALTFGPSAVPVTGPFTTLVKNPWDAMHYYVVLEDISVAGKRLNIPRKVFEPGPNGKGVTIDSGSLLTRLVDAAYDRLREAFVNQISGLPVAPPYSILDTCFYWPRGRRKHFIPVVTLHFRDGAQVDITANGLLVHATRDRERVCLAMTRTTDKMNVIGSYQQQRFKVSYDVDKRNVGFTPSICRAP